MSSRSPRFCLLIALLLSSLPELAAAADITWTNAAGGNWSTAANWNSGAGPVPGPGDVAHITTDGTYTVTLDVDATVGGVDLGAAIGTQTLRSSNRTLTLNGPSGVGARGVLSMGASTLGGVGPLTNQGSLSLNDVTVNPALANNGQFSGQGVVNLNGALTSAVGSTMYIWGNAFCCQGHLVVENGFTNYGTIVLSSYNGGSNSRLLVNNGVLVNAPGALIHLEPGAGGERVLETSLENHGTITADQGPALIHVRVGGTLVNASDGTIAVNANMTVTSPNSTNSGAMNVAAGRTLTFFEGRLTLNGTGLGGPGAILLRSVTANFNAAQNTGTTRITSITSTTINGPGSLTHVAAHSLFMSDVTINAAFINQSVVSGVGVVNLSGPLTTAVGSTMYISGNGFCCQGHLVVENGFTNNGTIVLSSYNGGNNSGLVVNNGVLVNAPGASIHLEQAAGGERVLGVSLDNYGTVTVDQGPMTFNKPDQVNRAGGTIAVNGGNVSVTSGGTFTNCGLITVASSRTLTYNGGTMINGSTGVLAGAGTYSIGSTFINAGTMAPGSIMNVAGNVTFATHAACPGGPGPSLNVDACGPAAGTGYDRLAISGTATLSGVLNVFVPPGCCLAPGDEFRVLTAGSRVGTFSSIDVSGHGNSVFDARYDATGLTLVVLSNLLTLNASAGSHGSISPSGVDQVPCGGSKTFTITPESCYQIADVLVDGISVGPVPSYTFTGASDDHTISATFEADRYVLSASAGLHGSISPSGELAVDCGTTHTYTVTPDPCYHIVDVVVDDVSQGAVSSYTFNTVTTHHSISASFALNSYTITAAAGSGGSIDPSGTGAVPCGSSPSFTITAGAGFTVADVLVDGSSVGAVATHEFTNVVANHTIAASFVSVVGNGPPIVSITGPPSGAVFAVGTPVTFTGSFVDEAGDTHTASWTFDGVSQAGSVNESGHTVSAVRSFATPGVYFATLTVTDDEGASGSATTVDGFEAMVVVYDPSGGFVTGGGWFSSPAGAYAASPSLAGKANFGFVSKYKRGATTPSGETEFQFKVANFNFHSTAYEWLVVAGARAQYKGSGTINGAGEYGFMLTASDGNLLGGNPPDKFRIKIWDNGSGASIYDNQLGAADSTTPSTALGGGSIVIHKGSAAGMASTLPSPGEPAEGVMGFALHPSLPNPTRDGAMISFDLPIEGHVHLAIYDAAGRVIATLADGTAAAGRHSVVWDGRHASGAQAASGLYLVRIEGRPTVGGDRWVATRKLARAN